MFRPSGQSKGNWNTIIMNLSPNSVKKFWYILVLPWTPICFNLSVENQASDHYCQHSWRRKGRVCETKTRRASLAQELSAVQKGVMVLWSGLRCLVVEKFKSTMTCFGTMLIVHRAHPEQNSWISKMHSWRLFNQMSAAVQSRTRGSKLQVQLCC